MGDVEIPNECDFFKEHSMSDDSNGDKYLNMDIGLQIEDREGTLEREKHQDGQVYPAGYCGY